MKLISTLLLSTLLLSLNGLRYFRNPTVSTTLSNPGIAAIANNDGAVFASDGISPNFDEIKGSSVLMPTDLGTASLNNYFTNDYASGNPGLGRISPQSTFDTVNSGSNLYPNLYSLTLGAQNYDNNGYGPGQVNVDNGLGSGFSIDGSGINIGKDPNSYFTTPSNIYSSNLSPQYSYAMNGGSPGLNAFGRSTQSSGDVGSGEGFAPSTDDFSMGYGSNSAYAGQPVNERGLTYSNLGNAYSGVNGGNYLNSFGYGDDTPTFTYS